MGASTRSLRPAFTQAPNVTSITVSRLRRGQTYYFRVRAERNGDYSSYSNIALSRVR